jgi:hypothetical protein
MRRTLLATAFLLAASSLQAKVYCYTLINSSGQVVSRSTSSQIDLSKNISDEMAAKHPRHHFMFGLEENCPDTSTSGETASSSAGTQGSQAAIANLARRYEATSLASEANYSSSGSWNSNSRPSGTSSTPGTDVHVRSYTRADGAQVPAHTRSARGRNR